MKTLLVVVLTQVLIFFSQARMAYANQPDIKDPARAKWLDHQNIELHFANGIIPRSDLRYYLCDGSQLHINVPQQSLPLSVKNVINHGVVLRTPNLNQNQIANLIKLPIQIVTTNSDGQVIDSTSLQLAGLLDEMFFSDARLGVNWENNQPVFRLWAPTAQRVRLAIFNNPSDQQSSQVIEMDENNGLWSVTGNSNWKNRFYTYEVTVYMPQTGRVEVNIVPDPYSFSLSTNSFLSQIVDMNDPQLKPAGWDNSSKPQLRSFSDIVLYELHLRDATAMDNNLPKELRGTYLGLVDGRSSASKQLQRLAASGVSHVHIMPMADFASVNEDKSAWRNEYPIYPPSWDSDEPQSLVGRNRNDDAYNWGYDPLMYFAPEGSYATDPNGNARILELRTMVQALNKINLRVVQDVVFNHTYSHGIENRSTLDRIVPLYYYRLDDGGNVQNSSCCSDTASENRMMEKLMIDAILHWAKNYKVDGFRFDLMSFHTTANLDKIRRAVGHDVYLYGEGWNFGSLVQKNSALAMSQQNAFGRGVGVFNDRIRDALRGGTTDSSEKSDQGFVTGLWYDFNQEPANRNTPMSMDGQRDKLLHLADVIKIGFAGNLRDYVIRDHNGNNLRGGQLIYRGSQTGFAAEPFETINYVSAHDGYTLWDAIQAKTPFFTPNRYPPVATINEKIRMHRLALATVILSQGIPFIEGGSEFLRSKSGDQNAYDSGDWFNHIDYSMKSNNWGAGLPPAWQNQDDWSFWRPRLREAQLQVTPQDMTNTNDYILSLISLRKNHPELRLMSSAEIAKRVSFFDDLGGQHPGLIAAKIIGNNKDLLVIFNASSNDQTLPIPSQYKTIRFAPELTPNLDSELRRANWDSNKGTMTIPARSTLVLEAEGGR